MASKDLETLKELWQPAYRQIELARERINNNYIIEGSDMFWCFVDWKEGLDKQASAQAIYIYTLNAAIELAKILGEKEIAKQLQEEKGYCSSAALKYLWDEKLNVFISGAKRQVSYASQVWMVLAGVIKGEAAGALIKRITEMNPAMGMVTPYMNHYYVEALILCGEKKMAVDYMKYYWGGMLSQGADTFWELYNPENPEESPYGSSAVNSYCHAWSCTPAYLLRKLEKEEKTDGISGN